MFSQALDFNSTYKSAIEMYSRGNYAGARVRFIVAERKANRENNYQGKQQALEYIDKSDECAQLIKDGERTFVMGEYEIAKRYFDRLAELNPKDPTNLDRSLKCRSEADYLATKKQADVYFNEKDWSQAYVLYNVCLDSTKSELSSYKRYFTEVTLRNQECLKQINLFNPDSIKIKLKNLKDKLNKKIKDSHGFIDSNPILKNNDCLNSKAIVIYSNKLSDYTNRSNLMTV